SFRSQLIDETSQTRVYQSYDGGIILAGDTGELSNRRLRSPTVVLQARAQLPTQTTPLDLSPAEAGDLEKVWSERASATTKLLEPSADGKPVRRSLVLSPNGKYFFDIPTARLIATATGETVRQYPGLAKVRSAAFSASGHELALGLGDNEFWVIDTNTGKRNYRIATGASPGMAAKPIDGVFPISDRFYAVNGGHTCSEDECAYLIDREKDSFVKLFEGYRIVGVSNDTIHGFHYYTGLSSIHFKLVGGEIQLERAFRSRERGQDHKILSPQGSVFLAQNYGSPTIASMSAKGANNLRSLPNDNGRWAASEPILGETGWLAHAQMQWTGGGEKWTLTLFTSEGKAAGSPLPIGRAAVMAFSPDGAFLAVASGTSVELFAVGGEGPRRIRLWNDIPAFKTLRFSEHNLSLFGVSEDGAVVALF
ncbi:hypothetical protein K2X33_01250, partial [bacterium]|nr:hypothetical protein [bacterium]